MTDIDPLTSNIEQLHTSLAGRATAGDVAEVEVGPDGSLHAIRLTDYGRRLDPDTLVDALVRLHATALTEARASVAAAVARLENDPRLLAQREDMIDAANQPLPPQSAGASRSADAPWPEPSPRPAAHREPTLEDDEEMDRYYQRKSWLE
ncbi:hypothetical protein [Nocardia mexicana]|uniref:YbaB/EbfC DNA-binding family protein n=1 Tax=Nocardia mexicana TaxID=279262 RepID=A0A370HGV4_9NOCA|nr:hypothetical protein [Nocardia mexicana]RDI56000.1 hypothetical protein DFR68_101837 [Nocardia mexicana]